MQEDRIKTLQSYIEKEPQEPFNYYALALEYLDEEPELALQQFNYLLVNHEDYLPTYYQLGKLLEQLDDEERALDIYLAGMELAEISDDEKAYQELKQAHRNLEQQSLL